MAAVSFPNRPSASYTPKAPSDSFLRTGYQRTKTNPRGYHWAVDMPAPRDTIIQAVAKSKLVDKGWGGDTGYWMEWLILEGPWKKRYLRTFHMSRACGHPIGKIVPRKYAIGRVGDTGNSTAPHNHSELGKYRWDKSRDPRWNPTTAFRDAATGGDY